MGENLKAKTAVQGITPMEYDQGNPRSAQTLESILQNPPEMPLAAPILACGSITDEGIAHIALGEFQTPIGIHKDERDRHTIHQSHPRP